MSDAALRSRACALLCVSRVANRGWRQWKVFYFSSRHSDGKYILEVVAYLTGSIVFTCCGLSPDGLQKEAHVVPSGIQRPGEGFQLIEAL